MPVHFEDLDPEERSLVYERAERESGVAWTDLDPEERGRIKCDYIYDRYTERD